MGGKSSPDFQGMSVAQGEANDKAIRDQTYANRPGQTTPWGYTSWDPSQFTDPGSGEVTTRWDQQQGLTPELQDLLNKQIAIQGGMTDIAGGLTGRLQSEYGQGIDYTGLNPMGQVPGSQLTLPEGGVDDPYQTRQRAEDAIYGKAASRLGTQFDSKRNALEIKMRNQGIGPQDEVWKSQMQSLGNQETDAYGQAQMDAVSGGRDESGQMFGQQMGLNQNTFNQSLGSNQQNFGQSMQRSEYANQIRQQQITEAMTKRGYGLNEINALLNGGQVGTPGMPNFSQGGASTPAPVYNAGVDAASAQNAQNPTAPLIGAAGSALGAFIANQ